MTKNEYSWNGHIKVITYNGPIEDGDIESVEEFKNTITTVGKNLLLTALSGGDAKVRYMAWGTGTTAPAAGQTQLVTESGRKAITNFSVGTGTSYITRCYLSPNDANIHIQELGWHAGTTATSTKDSGTMLARVLYDHDKTTAESLLIERTDTFA